MTALTELSLLDVSAKIRAKEVSPVEVTDACLARAEATEPKLNAFSNLMPEKARAAAKAAEAEIAAGGWRGPLHGIPVGIKELYDVAGEPTTSSSRVRVNWVAETDSASVAQLRAAGAIIMGKTHTHEFAYGFITPESRNPWNPDHIPGGSSGGSGAAVAAGSCYVGMGSDTGGSIRQPSALCGTVGLKPTFGRCSRFGVTSLSWSLDHVGPLTRTVGDAAVTLNALAGHDPRDPGSIDVPVDDYALALGRDVKGMRIGVPKNHFFDLLDPEVDSAVRGAIETLAGQGAIVSEVEIPFADQLMAVEFAICLPEASEYHRRMLRESPDLYLPDVQEVLERGEMIPATRYIQALRLRRLIQQGWAAMMRDVDVVIAPSSAVPAPKVGVEEIEWGQGVAEQLMNTFARITAPGNVVGLPAVAMPCGFSSDGLPVGFQAIGRPFEESTVLRLCDAYERMTDWTSRRPSI
jgi:aspartyl-tRNA(Asn)/glutamyl-tRNA(Gln) amidotransferase subunit A